MSFRRNRLQLQRFLSRATLNISADGETVFMSVCIRVQLLRIDLQEHLNLIALRS